MIENDKKEYGMLISLLILLPLFIIWFFESITKGISQTYIEYKRYKESKKKDVI